jgi:uncharacterized protein with PIN domain
MKFVADTMLGRLARWLRLLGFDVLYPNLDDKELLKFADERIILTRDKELGEKENVFLIKSVDVNEQMKQVINELRVEINTPLSRCSVCNQVLVEEDKKSVKNLVPERIYKSNDMFWRCPGCNRIYWKGSHYDKIMKKIEELGNK